MIFSKDLIAVLERGLFSGTALDAFGEEPLSVDDLSWVYKVVVVGEGDSSSGRVEENLVIINSRVSVMPVSVDEIVALYRENLLAFTSEQLLLFVVNM